MKKLMISASVTAVLAFFAVLALIFLYLSLSDIAKHEPDLTLEWYTAGVCIIILSIFTISTIITLGLLLNTININRKVKEVIENK